MRNGKKDRILRILLNNVEEPLTKYQIAKLAECSESWVGEFLKMLEEKGLVKNTTVLKKKEVYDYWLENGNEYEFKRYLVQDPIKLLGKVNLNFAITTYLGESITQHHLFPSKIEIYADEKDKEKWTSILRDKGLLGGGNFKIMFSDKHIFYKCQEIQSESLGKIVKVVSKPQLILDLFKEGGSCVEAANNLLVD